MKKNCGYEKLDFVSNQNGNVVLILNKEFPLNNENV